MHPRDITCAILDHRQHKIIVGDEMGRVSCYSYDAGLLLKSTLAHSKQVTALTYCNEVRVVTQRSHGMAYATIKAQRISTELQLVCQCGVSISHRLSLTVDVAAGHVHHLRVVGPQHMRVRRWQQQRVPSDSVRALSVRNSDLLHRRLLVQSCVVVDFLLLWCSVVRRAHGKDITCVAFNYELSVIATGATDGTVRLWDFQVRECEKQLHRHAP
jgi:WD40 repeat protein